MATIDTVKEVLVEKLDLDADSITEEAPVLARHAAFRYNQVCGFKQQRSFYEYFNR